MNASAIARDRQTISWPARRGRRVFRCKICPPHPPYPPGAVPCALGAERGGGGLSWRHPHLPRYIPYLKKQHRGLPDAADGCFDEGFAPLFVSLSTRNRPGLHNYLTMLSLLITCMLRATSFTAKFQPLFLASASLRLEHCGCVQREGFRVTHNYGVDLAQSVGSWQGLTWLTKVDQFDGAAISN